MSQRRRFGYFIYGGFFFLETIAKGGQMYFDAISTLGERNAGRFRWKRTRLPSNRRLRPKLRVKIIMCNFFHMTIEMLDTPHLWPELFRKIVEVRHLAYRHATGVGHAELKFETLVDIDDLRSIFLLVVDEDNGEIVHVARATGPRKGLETYSHIFTRWSLKKCVTQPEWISMTRAATNPLEKYLGRDFYRLSIPALCLVMRAAEHKTSMAMLAPDLPASLRSVLVRLGFKHIPIHKLGDGPFSREELSIDAVWCDCGYVRDSSEDSPDGEAQLVLLQPFRASALSHRTCVREFMLGLNGVVQNNVDVAVDKPSFLTQVMYFQDRVDPVMYFHA